MKIFVGRDVGIGDMIMVNATLEQLRMKYPDAHITFGCGPAPMSEFVETNPNVDEIVTFPDNGHELPHLRRAEDAIKSYVEDNADQYDKAYLLFPHDYFAAECRERGIHLAQFYAEMAGVELPEATGRLWLTEEDHAAAEALIEEHALGQFAAMSHKTFYTKGPKQWPLGKFQRVIDHLTEKGVPTVAFGSLKDEKMERCLNLQGFSLRTVAALIERSSLFIGNDTGLTHVAAALDVPILAIHPSTYPEVTGAMSDKALYFRGYEKNGEMHYVSCSDVLKAINLIF